MASDRFAPARAEASNSGPDGAAASGLVTLADLRRRRAEALQITAGPEPRRARGGEGGGGRSGGAATTGAAAKKRRRKAVALSFAGDEEDEGGGEGLSLKGEAQTAGDKKEKAISAVMMASPSSAAEAEKRDAEREGITANAAVPAPKLRSRAALRREALEREALRQEFLALQAAVRATEFALPFVFYDGTNLSGGIVRLKKGDPVWLFLDRGRKMAAAGTAGGGFKPGVGGERMSFRARREWARVSVDDLMLVRDSVIIPPHYEFYYFILNKTVGHGGRLLFDYSNEPPPAPPSEPEQGEAGGRGDGKGDGGGDGQEKGDGAKPGPAEVSVVKLPAPPSPISSLEGASDDPALTKIVNRRWFERNKHIFPASMWREFDPEANYAGEIRRDTGGNAFFFAK